MPIIYCETSRTGVNEFELIRSTYVGLWGTKEEVEQLDEPDNDRLRAAIINVGKACAMIHRVGFENSGTVAIVSDVDGKDTQGNGEHDVLHSLLNPATDELARKHKGLYKEYMRYLDRIGELRRLSQIKIVLCPRGKLVTYSGKVVDV